jgi:hypothetical protein
MLSMCICWLFYYKQYPPTLKSYLLCSLFEEPRATLVWKAILQPLQAKTDSLQCLPSPAIQWHVTCVGDETLLNKPRQRNLKLMSINIADSDS